MTGMPIDQRFAVADLVGYAEGLCNSGCMGDVVELQLRQRIAAVLVAFNMPSKAEMARVIDGGTAKDLSVIRAAIDRRH